MRALDIGCGIGYGTSILNKTGKYQKVYSVDQKEIMLCFRNENVFFDIANAEDLPFKNEQFDLITCMMVLDEVDNPSQVLFEIKRVLKNEGVCVITVPNKLVASPLKQVVNPYTKTRWDDQEFYAYVSNYFNIVEQYGQKYYHRTILQKNKLKLLHFIGLLDNIEIKDVISPFFRFLLYVYDFLGKFGLSPLKPIEGDLNPLNYDVLPAQKGYMPYVTIALLKK